MTTEHNQKIDLTPQQTNPYTARPEDWVIGSPVQSNKTPGHGQRGLSRREEYLLLALRKARGRGVKLPTDVNAAGPPQRF
jgi:hypothetical protein